MTSFSLSIIENDFGTLYEHLIQPDRNERAAYLLCSTSNVSADPWDGSQHRNYLVKNVIPVSKKWIISSSRMHVTWDTNSFVAALKRAQSEGLTVAIVHNHGIGNNHFSPQDDANEADLIRMAINRNGPNTSILSLIITPDRLVCGRVWRHSN